MSGKFQGGSSPRGKSSPIPLVGDGVHLVQRLNFPAGHTAASVSHPHQLLVGIDQDFLLCVSIQFYLEKILTNRNTSLLVVDSSSRQLQFLILEIFYRTVRHNSIQPPGGRHHTATTGNVKTHLNGTTSASSTVVGIPKGKVQGVLPHVDHHLRKAGGKSGASGLCSEGKSPHSRLHRHRGTEKLAVAAPSP